ncbi:MAG: hypothetical protein JOZ93_10095, partial [Sinobacteraceae bacterium]|nr:hypothetical protein [Nevskiaceae bacterium]
MYDPGEYFLDFNKDGMRNPPDMSATAFKGITCSGSPLTCSNDSIAIGASHLIIMSTSAANITPVPTSLSVAHSTTTPPVTNTVGLQFTVVDLNGNAMPAGTTIAVTADSAIGTLSGPGVNWTIGCDSGVGGVTLGVTLTAGTSAASGNITITVTTPGTKTVTVLPVPVSVT